MKKVRRANAKEQATIRVFKKWSPFYDSPATKLLYFNRVQPDIIRALTKILQELPGRNVRCLDVACGTGEILAKIAPRFPGVQFVGADLSDDMLAVAKTKCSILPNVSFVSGNARNLPFANASFELVICTDSLHHFSSATEAMREMRRVVTHGGALFIADPAHNNLFQKTILAIFGAIFDKPEKYYSRKELEALLSENDLSRSSYRYKYFTNFFVARG